jgi:hypothetical protein
MLAGFIAVAWQPHSKFTWSVRSQDSRKVGKVRMVGMIGMIGQLDG